MRARASTDLKTRRCRSCWVFRAELRLLHAMCRKAAQRCASRPFGANVGRPRCYRVPSRFHVNGETSPTITPVFSCFCRIHPSSAADPA